MSRLTDVISAPPTPPLPIINWPSVGQCAPVLVPVPARAPTDPLPPADVVLITWTNAEWSAFDHVFTGGTTERTIHDVTWQQAWLPYTKGAPAAPPAHGSSPDFHLWGFFRLVEIANAAGALQRVLLFKAQAHLAYAPFLPGLTSMAENILQDTGATRLYSLGTAGGVGEDDFLGNSVITNAGTLNMTLLQNASPLNHQTFTCSTWFPETDLVEQVQATLGFSLAQVATEATYQALFLRLTAAQQKEGVTLTDLLNPPLNPSNLKVPSVKIARDQPLLTTDFYYIAQPGDAAKYCILEMDDAVLGAVAGHCKVDFVFVRNVSDPIVPAQTLAGQKIPDELREAWSSLIYTAFGFYTSYNGALAAWATLARA